MHLWLHAWFSTSCLSGALDYTKILLQFSSCKNRNALWILHKYIYFKVTLISTYWHTFQMQTLKNRYTNAGFTLKKAFFDYQRQHKKIGEFFLFHFFFRPTDPSNFEKNLCSQKLNWSGLIMGFAKRWPTAQPMACDTLRDLHVVKLILQSIKFKKCLARLDTR